jgi:hypothetical protein
MAADDYFNLFVLVCQIASKPVEAFLRVPGTVGVRYFNLQAVVGTCALLLWVTSWHPGHAVLAFYASAIMFAIHRLARRWTPIDEHSMYTGRSWIPGDELTVKGVWEVLFVALTGILLLGPSPGLGTWLLLSAVGLLGTHSHFSLRMKAIDRSIRDALAEQRQMLYRRGQLRSPGAYRVPTRRRAWRWLLVIVPACGIGWMLYTGRLDLDRLGNRLLPGSKRAVLEREYQQKLRATPPDRRRFAPTFKEYVEEYCGLNYSEL